MLSNLMVTIVAALISIAQPQAAQQHVDLSVEQTTCLAEAVYFESRSEGTIGEVAVSYVILNRAELEQKSICGVIHERGQFSFYSPYRHYHIREQEAWRQAAQIAVDTQLGVADNPIGNATFYNTVPMRSLRHVVYVGKIRHHYFYEYASAADVAPLVPAPVYVPPPIIHHVHRVSYHSYERHHHYRHYLKSKKIE
jgi:spore germination cell wall hydrolase CwlJ-like protein